jgi:hypothetical protein
VISTARSISSRSNGLYHGYSRVIRFRFHFTCLAGFILPWFKRVGWPGHKTMAFPPTRECTPIPIWIPAFAGMTGGRHGVQNICHLRESGDPDLAEACMGTACRAPPFQGRTVNILFLRQLLGGLCMIASIASGAGVHRIAFQNKCYAER